MAVDKDIFNEITIFETNKMNIAITELSANWVAWHNHSKTMESVARLIITASDSNF